MSVDHEALAALRKDIILELDAVNIYTEHYDRIENEEVRALLAHIIEEEKEHVAEFMEMVNRFDEVQAGEFSEEHVELVKQGRAQEIESEEAEQLEAPATPSGSLTVGSLIGEPQ